MNMRFCLSKRLLQRQAVCFVYPPPLYPNLHPKQFQVITFALTRFPGTIRLSFIPPFFFNIPLRAIMKRLWGQKEIMLVVKHLLGNVRNEGKMFMVRIKGMSGSRDDLDSSG